ncbi:uncharacterized protein LAESUDRAFT_562492 [Laetiporus sulphureus 93-53]|uniref:Uncharacterized protein n=1 Tax=Laetiporus sulphureus 93-53 TaxID=1314785 RepID=A0A165B4P7_9APHY|nr:uncharacterized protein LAESUDRAFT_562492 [Laetiporus sulphureus 93-53]KZT00230.1 hypothetical protein LAESUDRAFT_562492 [Laetiporus sulphureus 93-53]
MWRRTFIATGVEAPLDESALDSTCGSECRREDASAIRDRRDCRAPLDTRVVAATSPSRAHMPHRGPVERLRHAAERRAVVRAGRTRLPLRLPLIRRSSRPPVLASAHTALGVPRCPIQGQTSSLIVYALISVARHLSNLGRARDLTSCAAAASHHSRSSSQCLLRM